jgi:hypothetical protein
MTNNTEVYWEVAQLTDPTFASALSLHTMAWSVATWGGRRFVPVPKRGEDRLIPNRTGRRFLQKTRESQVISLKMWMVPLNEDGSTDDTMTLEQKRDANWLHLLRTIDVDGQVYLKKRWWENGSLHSAIATAEFAGGMEPESQNLRQEFNIDFLLADPYFYEAHGAVPVGSINVEGDSTTDHVVITLTGGTNPTVTFPDGNYIGLTGALAGTVTINLLAGTAIRTTGQYVNGLVRRNPAFSGWPVLRPGTNNLVLSGGGSATVSYDAAWR